MDSVFTILVAAAALIGSALVALLLAAPLGAFAIWRYGKTGRHLHLRAFLVSGLNATGQGLAVGLAGFAFGAAVPDESAGDAAIMLAVFGLLVGGLMGFAMSYLLIYVGCRRVARRSAAR